MKNLINVLTVLVTLFILVGPAHGQDTGNVEGVVVSDAVGRALPGVNVYLDGTVYGTATGRNGQYRLAGIPPGEYILTASFVGFTSERIPVSIVAGETKEVDVGLEQGGYLLEEITVKGDAFLPQNAAATAHVIGLEEIRALPGDNPLRLLEQAPGVDLGAYRQGGVADVFSIRGFGEGGHGGDVAVQVDGIPLNEADGHADGYADLNVLVPLELERISVYKGPSTALFGNFARGGTVAIDTRRSGDYSDFYLSGGAYETIDAQLAFGQRLHLGAGKKPLQSNLAFQFFSTDGYAANSRYLKGTLSGRFSYDIGPRTDANVSLRAHRGEWSGPGYIPEEQFLDEERRRLQGPNAEDDGGIKSFYAERIGVNHSINDRLRLVSFAYAVQQDFTRYAKFGYEPGGQSERFNQRGVYGAGTSLNGNAELGQVPATFVLGAEIYSERTQRKRWATSNRVRRDQIQDRDFDIQNAALFIQADIEPSPYFRPTVGLRFDQFFGQYENADPGQTPITSDLQDLAHLSPKFGLRSMILSGLDVRFSATNGYILPNGPDKYDATLNVDPSEIWQYEAGLTYDPGASVRLDLVGYLLDTSKEIVEDPPGSGVFRNAGKTRRRGIEAEVTVRPVTRLRVRLVAGAIDTEILENPDATLVGKKLTGVPSRTLSGSVDYVSTAGLGGRLHVHNIGAYQLDALNAVQYDGYTVADLTLYYELGAGFTRGGRLFVQIENVLNERYAEAVFSGFGTLNYAPAPPRRVSAGISVGL